METKPLMHQHGGDLDAIERKYGIPKAEILDFSGNINPLGFPESVKTALAKNLDIISTYPDKHYTALREAIGAYTGANPKHIVVGNGSTELIGTFIKTVNAKKSLIMGPAYALINPFKCWINVDFPEPVCPIMPTNSPSWISKFTSKRACCSKAVPFPYT